jgi:hypothetical protein
MAELGYIASIAALACTGLKVTKVIYDLTDELGEVGRQLEVYGRELSTFHAIWLQLGPTLEENHAWISPDLQSSLETSCDAVNSAVETFRGRLEKYRRLAGWRKVMTHFLRRNELSLPRGELESLKTLLSLVVGTLK